MPNQRSLVGAMVLSVALSSSSGQVVVHPPVKVTNTPGCIALPHGVEPALIASRTNGNRLVIVVQSPAVPDWTIFYAVSDDGARTFTCPQTLIMPSDPNTCSAESSTDPMVAALANGDILVGGLARRPGGPPDTVVVSRIPPGSTVSTGSSQPTPCTLGADKCFMAAGPWPPLRPPGVPAPATSETVYVSQSPYQASLWAAHSTDALPTGLHWTHQPGTYGYVQEVIPAGQTNAEHGGFPVVMRGGLDPGRVVLAYGHVQHPHVTYSRTGGESVPGWERWEAGTRLDSYLEPNPPNPPTSIDLLAIGPPPQPIPGGGALRVYAHPSVAVDPGNPDTLLVAFTGRAVVEPSNLDIFVSRTLNQAESFSTYRITDAMVGQAGVESDEFMPSIAIDGLGGVNLLFCRTQDPDNTQFNDTRVRVRYARWPSFQAIIDRQKPFIADLSSDFLPWFGAGNDYHMVVAVGCTVYAAYASREPGVSAPFNIFVSAIDLNQDCAPADVDANGHVDGDDLAAFIPAFVGVSSLADRDRDGAITSHDTALFLTSYYNAGGPPP